MNTRDTLPRDGARFALPDEPALPYEPQQPEREKCSCCEEALQARHICNICDFCADLLPFADRERVRRMNLAPDGSGASGRLLALGAQPWRRNLWTVPGVPELLSCRDALRHFGPDELPASMR